MNNRVPEDPAIACHTYLVCREPNAVRVSQVLNESFENHKTGKNNLKVLNLAKVDIDRETRSRSILRVGIEGVNKVWIVHAFLLLKIEVVS